jgi:hypothetical protein
MIAIVVSFLLYNYKGICNPLGRAAQAVFCEKGGIANHGSRTEPRRLRVGVARAND